MEIKKTKNKSRRTLSKPTIIIDDSISEEKYTAFSTPEKIEEELVLPNQNNGDNISIKQNITDNIHLDVSSNKNSYDLSFFLKKNKRLVFFYIPWTLLLLFILSSFYLWFKLSEIKKDPLKAAQAETTEIVAMVGKIIVLPTDEVPKIATLTEEDIAKVKSQPFFTNAKAGDKILVYSIAKKVILYSPKTNKIIEVVNLNSDNNPGSSKAL